MAEFGKKNLRINKKYESLPCAWCGDALMLGAEGAVCEACGTPQHLTCWEQNNGCGLSGCVNAPLNAIEDLQEKEIKPLKSDEKLCPHCGKIIYIEASVCRHCGLIASVDGLYHGETTVAPEAQTALWLSIAAFLSNFFVGLILRNCALVAVIYLAVKALGKASEAKRLIARDPKFGGKGLVLAAQIVAIFALVLPVISIILAIAILSNRP